MAWLNNETSHPTIGAYELGNWHPQVTGVQQPMRTYGTCSNHKGYVRTPRYVRTRAGVQGGPPFCIALHGGEGYTTRPLTYGEDLPPQLPPLLGPPLPTSHHGGGPHPHGPPGVTCPRTYVAKSGGNGHGSDYVRTFVRARTPLTTYVRTDYAWPIASGVFSADAARKCGGTYVYVRT